MQSFIDAFSNSSLGFRSTLLGFKPNAIFKIRQTSGFIIDEDGNYVPDAPSWIEVKAHLSPYKPPDNELLEGQDLDSTYLRGFILDDLTLDSLPDECDLTLISQGTSLNGLFRFFPVRTHAWSEAASSFRTLGLHVSGVFATQSN